MCNNELDLRREDININELNKKHDVVGKSSLLSKIEGWTDDLFEAIAQNLEAKMHKDSKES